MQYFNHKYNDYILGGEEGDVIYDKHHFYIQYNGGQEKSIFEIKMEKFKTLVAIARVI